MRHGGTALLPAREVFFGFAHFGALQVADFQGDFFAQRGCQREGGDEVGMTIALDHLRGDGCGLEVQAGADHLFHFGTDVREGSDGAGSLAHAQVFSGGADALQVAFRFLIPDGDLETEGDGLGMDSVGPADLDGVLKLECAALEDGLQRFQVAEDDGGGLLQEERLRGIDDVVGGEAVVQPARRFGVPGGGHAFGNGGGEGDDVVLHLALNFQDAMHVEAGVGAEEAGGVAGHHTKVGQRFGGGQFHFQPLLKLVLFAPDVAHGGPRVSCNHNFSG